VTLTTVGYGDIVPKTSTGRWAGVVIMFTGIAVLGVLSGSLASFRRLASSSDDDDSSSAETDSPSQPLNPSQAVPYETLLQQMAELQDLIARLTELWTARPRAIAMIPGDASRTATVS